MKVVISGVLIAVVSGVGYVLAPSFGLDASSWLFGSLVTGVLVALANGRSGASAAGASKKGAKPSRAVKSSDGNMMTLYVGNLAFKANRHALAKLFGEYGDVINARIATDRNTRKPRGYGFVEMSVADAQKAMGALDGETFFGRKLNVTEAKDQKKS